jgi:ketosteroid isomerase-like protein
MRYLALGLLAAIALSGAGRDMDAEKQVLAAMDTYKNAMINKDGAALAQVLGDDLEYTHSAGQFETKADVIKSITSGKTIVQKIEFSDTKVRIFGNMALVKGRVDLWHSPTNIVHMNVLHVFEKRPQGWQMVARQATRLAN